ncbi:unnamed protein product [Symbiodinium microadriaticum]|nr:unnamed protein product [Symbiodinium microadriaticum]
MSDTPLHQCAAALGETPEVEMTKRRSGRDEVEFPMYTVEMQDLLVMTELKPFEEMLALGGLTAFSESLGHAIFVSHQWAGHHHPDPKHQQIRIFQEAMKNLLSGSSRVRLPISAELAFGRLRCPSAKDFQSLPLFVWYDYLCCPQDLSSEAIDGRSCAIRSIPAYVAKCEYFVILCPVVEHVDERKMLSLASWAERGWCRTERLARELSARKQGYSIVIHGAKQQTLSMDILRLLEAPGLGKWSRESDKPIVASALTQMIWNKLLYLLEQGDLHGYRFLLSRQVPCCYRGLDMEPVDGLVPAFRTNLDPFEDADAFALARFLHQSGFRKPVGERRSGWSPLCFAAVNGNPMLVRALLNQKANPDDRLRRSEGSLFPARVGVLSMAAHFHNNEVMEILLEARATLTSADMINATAAHWASLANNVAGLRLLCQARADFQRRNFVGMNVFEVACSNGAVGAMAEILTQVPSTSLRLGLHYALLFYGAYEEPIRFLLRARANLNEPFDIQIQQPAWWILLHVASARHRISPSSWTLLAYHHKGATPLMFSILTGSFEIASLLLSARACTDAQNARKKTAADLAQVVNAPESLVEALRGPRPRDVSSEDTPEDCFFI